MSRPPTMLIREADDERTLVDPRFSPSDPPSDDTALFFDTTGLSAPEPPFEGSGRAVSPAAHAASVDEPTGEAQPVWQGLHAQLSKRGLLEMGLVLVVVFVLGALAYQQWRIADRLQKTIDEMQIGASESFIQRPVASPTQRLAPIRGGTRLEAATREVGVDERERLESRGASLIGSNDFSGALTHYQTLSELFPSETVFRDIADVLRTKLRCAGPSGTESGSCP